MDILVKKLKDRNYEKIHYNYFVSYEFQLSGSRKIN